MRIEGGMPIQYTHHGPMTVATEPGAMSDAKTTLMLGITNSKRKNHPL